MTDAALIALERSVQVCEHGMQVCERAEALAWEMLARTDRYGAGTADVVRWEELLERVANVHVRQRTLKVRLSATHGP
jgi:hypothetical protein